MEGYKNNVVLYAVILKYIILETEYHYKKYIKRNEPQMYH